MNNNLINKPLETAVLFLVFKRLDTTMQVFEEISKAKPPRLYIASDGPRANKIGEAAIVESVRQYVLDSIDWQCEVKTLFRSENLGCKYAVSSAIDWFFSHEEQGIILEDDCLPSQSFFWYCEELLNKYKDNEQIMIISGDNFQGGVARGDASYYFSALTHIWGWASWARVWQLYDVEFFHNNEFGNVKLPEVILQHKDYFLFWQNVFATMKVDDAHTIWDHQLSYTAFKYKMLNINPNVNLISNIGFGNNATHTHDKKNKNASLPKQDIKFLYHPNKIEANIEAFIHTSNEQFKYIKPSFIEVFKTNLKRTRVGKRLLKIKRAIFKNKM